MEMYFAHKVLKSNLVGSEWNFLSYFNVFLPRSIHDDSFVIMTLGVMLRLAPSYLLHKDLFMCLAS